MTKITYIELADDRLLKITDWMLTGERSVLIEVFRREDKYSVNSAELTAALIKEDSA